MRSQYPVFQVYQARPTLLASVKPAPVMVCALGVTLRAKRLIEWVVSFLLRTAKMQVLEVTEIQNFKTITVRRDEFGRAITEHLHRFVMEHGEYPDRILVGRDFYHGLIGELNQYLAFTATGFRHVVRGRFGSVEYQGVLVVCIPWMHGVLPIPKALLTEADAHP